jgi:hypothetical protein
MIGPVPFRSNGRINRVAREGGVDGLYEQIGRTIAEFLDARRQNPFVSAEDYIARFVGHEDEARDCFEIAELLTDLIPAHRRRR